MSTATRPAAVSKSHWAGMTAFERREVAARVSQDRSQRIVGGIQQTVAVASMLGADPSERVAYFLKIAGVERAEAEALFAEAGLAFPC